MSEFITNAELRIEAERICDENDQLRAENAKLKRAAERDADFLESLNLSLEESQSENAKLREFVYDMWNDMNVYYTQHERPDSSDMDFYRDRMRELGIEVEDD